MKNYGNDFRDALVEYINSWNEPLEVLYEVNIGSRFIGTPRKLDIVIRNKINNKYVGIECKVQMTQGTAYEKLSYALDDCLASPIPTILAFGGPHIRDDMKSKLITSGVGLCADISLDNNNILKFEDPCCLIRQRCYIELGLNWFPFATGDKIPEQLADLGY